MINLVSQKIQRQNLLFQFVFWIGFFFIGQAKIYVEYDHPVYSMIIPYDLCHLLFQIIAGNFVYYVLIKKIFYRKQYFLFTVYLVLSLYLLSVLNRIFAIYVAEPFFIDIPKDDLYSILTDLNYLFCYYFIPILTAVFIFISVLFMLDLRTEKQNSVQLLKEKAEMELMALKTRLNPHFLFNTLNNIYSLSVINSEKTSESISRLSDMLDYILYKSDKKLVFVSEEIKVIRDYTELEKLRYNTRLELKITENISSENRIPPLIFLSLTENAFKHSAADNNGIISISVFVETNSAKSILRVENSFAEKEMKETKGMGLKIIQEQLRIIYGSKASYSVEKENGIFKVEIIIPADEN